MKRDTQANNTNIDSNTNGMCRRAWHGMAWQGVAGQDTAGQSGHAWHDMYAAAHTFTISFPDCWYDGCYL